MDEVQVIRAGLVPDPNNEENRASKQSMKDKGISFEEFSIETDIEAEDVTQFYLQESRKIKANKGSQQEEDDEDNLEDAFLSRVAGNIKDQKRIEKLSKNAMPKDDKEEDDDEEGWQDEEMNEAEMKELEKLIESKHANYSKIPM